MDHRLLEERERLALLTALRGNVSGRAILMDRRTTRFAGTADDLDDDAEVVNAIKSVPCHYS